MKPDWDKLMAEFKDDKTRLVADVDCTTAGQPLCEQNGVRGYPSIKTGDPAGLEDYNGGRDLAALKKHVEGLKPLCSPMNLDLCDEKQKKEIEDIQKMSGKELKAKIEEGDKKLADAEQLFKDELGKLQKHAEQLNKDKEATITKVKEDGLGLLKSVQAARKKDGEKEEL